MVRINMLTPTLFNAMLTVWGGSLSSTSSTPARPRMTYTSGLSTFSAAPVTSNIILSSNMKIFRLRNLSSSSNWEHHVGDLFCLELRREELFFVQISSSPSGSTPTSWTWRTASWWRLTSASWLTRRLRSSTRSINWTSSSSIIVLSWEESNTTSRSNVKLIYLK